MEFKCQICNKECENLRKMAKHINNNHKIKSKDYYDRYLKSSDEGNCIYCGKVSLFDTIATGYKKSCIACRSNRAKDFRRDLKNNILKFETFSKKVSDNQKKIWKERELLGTKDQIHKKVSNTNKKKNELLTVDERKERFGYLNRLSEDEKEIWKNEVMFQTGMFSWWRNATEEDKLKIIIKRCCTLRKVSIELVELSNSNRQDFKIYNQVVRYITEITYNRYKNIIDPYGIRGKNWHLDHKVSIKVGFIKNIDPFIIAHQNNLEIISAEQNVSKNMGCSIDIKDLIESIEK